MRSEIGLSIEWGARNELKVYWNSIALHFDFDSIKVNVIGRLFPDLHSFKANNNTFMELDSFLQQNMLS